jgi:hypothetical protein
MEQRIAEMIEKLESLNYSCKVWAPKDRDGATGPARRIYLADSRGRNAGFVEILSSGFDLSGSKFLAFEFGRKGWAC